MQMFFDGFYPELPKYWILANVEPRHIPTYSAVYIIVGRDNVVKYVGQTTSMRQRYKDHTRWMDRKDKIGWVSCTSDELMFLESWFIATLRPYKNQNQNKKSLKAAARKSATLDVATESVWKIGRRVELIEPRVETDSRKTWLIEDVNKNAVKFDGRWWSRHQCTVRLP